MGKAGKKSQRNHGELYSEVKTCQVMLTMTPTGKQRLDRLAAGLSLSRSELIEQWSRGLLDLHEVALQLNEINIQ